MKYSSNYRPSLRWPLDIQPVEVEQGSFLLLKDDLGLAPEVLVLPRAFGPVLARCDGSRSLATLTAELSPFGFTAEVLQQFLERLDQSFLLEGERFEQRLLEIRLEFAASPVREAVHAGRVYPADASQLASVLSAYVADGPSVNVQSADSVGAMICPHIDYQRGWRGYAAAYRVLEQLPPPDVLVLIGTSHQPSDAIFHGTAKAFSTPLGSFLPASDEIQFLAGRFGNKRYFAEELLHRGEHSLELQLPFLAHCYPQPKRPTIVPILVGSFHQYLLNQLSPVEDGEVADFVGALAELLQQLRSQGKRALVFGGVDLAHLGSFFGDQGTLSTDQREQVRQRDTQLLDAVLSGSAEALHGHIAEDIDARRICGYPSMYTMFKAIEHSGAESRGTSVWYEQAYDESLDCLVSFASAYWQLTARAA